MHSRIFFFFLWQKIVFLPLVVRQPLVALVSNYWCPLLTPPPTHTYAPFFGIFLCQLRLHAAISVAAKLVRAYWVCPLPFPWPQQYWGSRVLQSRQLTIHSRSAKKLGLFVSYCVCFFFFFFFEVQHCEDTYAQNFAACASCNILALLHKTKEEMRYYVVIETTEIKPTVCRL